MCDYIFNKINLLSCKLSLLSVIFNTRYVAFKLSVYSTLYSGSDTASSLKLLIWLLNSSLAQISTSLLKLNQYAFSAPKAVSSTLNLRNLFLMRNPVSTRVYVDLQTVSILSVNTFYKNIRSFVLPLIISMICFVVLLDFFSVDFLRQTAVWAVFGFLAFWLFSGFNFFVKHYRFGKFTSAIQRFWKRTNSYFWCIEGFMFGLFLYYFLNSSQEPLYMYDESNLNQNFLPSLTATYQSYLLLLFAFFYILYLKLALPTFKSTQQILHLGLLTLVFTYIYLLENYQVYYILTSFYENFWIYDAEHLTWSMEIEVPRIRTKHQYLLIALVLKYWHFVFIYLSWLFVVMKSFEKRQLSITLLGLASQNTLILFCLNIVFTCQWVKWVFRRFGDTAYYWFFTAPSEFTTLTFVQELFIICLLYILF